VAAGKIIFTPDTLNDHRDLAREVRNECPSLILFNTSLSGAGKQEFRHDRW